MEQSDKLLANIQREIATLTAQCNAMSESTEKATVTQEERMVSRQRQRWRVLMLFVGLYSVIDVLQCFTWL